MMIKTKNSTIEGLLGISIPDLIKSNIKYMEKGIIENKIIFLAFASLIINAIK